MYTRILPVAFLSLSSPLLRCRFRRTQLPQCASTCQQQQSRRRTSSTDAFDKAHAAMSYLATSPASWKRFQDLVELALTDDDDDSTCTMQSAVDVGTDHGFLAISLAASGRFGHGGVFGVDASEQALQSGAFRVHETLQKYWSETANNKEPLPVAFRVGNGLQGLEQGQAYLVCIAGMGINTMLQILSQKAEDELLLCRLGTQRILLQPTSSRPRHLLTLYHGLHQLGWRINDERIQQVGPRSYFSTSWQPVRRQDQSVHCLLPGTKLAESSPNPVFHGYLRHHCKWLREDLEKTGTLQEREAEWLQTFESILDNRDTLN